MNNRLIPAHTRNEEAIRYAIVNLHTLATHAVKGEQASITTTHGVFFDAPALNLHNRAPWLSAAAMICDLACTDLIDAVQVPGFVHLEEIFNRAAAPVRAQIRAPGSWAQPTVDFAIENLIAVIAGLDALIADLRR